MRNHVVINPVIGFIVAFFIAGLACSQSAAPPGSPPLVLVTPATTPAGVGAVPPIDFAPSLSPTSISTSPLPPAVSKTTTPVPTTTAETTVQIDQSSATSTIFPSETPINLPQPSQTSHATSSAIENAVLTPTNPVPEIGTDRPVVSDDFNGGGAWAQGTVEGSFEFGYTDETYRFVVQVPNLDVWSIRGQTYSNLRQDIVIASFAGATDGFTGVVCRWNGSNNYYRFTVDPSGLFRITRIFSAEIVDLATASGPGLTESVSVPYRLRAECNGNILALYLNDTLIISAEDNFFMDGNFGIVTGTLINSPFTAEIDSFALYLP